MIRLGPSIDDDDLGLFARGKLKEPRMKLQRWKKPTEHPRLMELLFGEGIDDCPR